MPLLYFLTFAIIPSIIWLAFFLREDRRPEPKGMILKVFILGMLSTIPVIILSLAIAMTMKTMGVPSYLVTLLGVVVIAAITEEVFKYLVVRYSVIDSSSCDEPSDLMIYAITAALGFAAMENILFLFPGKEALFGVTPIFYIQELIAGSIVRFISGTFLHALVSGLMGYFIALSIMHTRHRKRLIWTGLTIAILLHGLYNFSIITSEDNGYWFLVAPIILFSLFILVLYFFSRTRKMASICKFENKDIKKNENNS